jgi:hypothetical protein
MSPTRLNTSALLPAPTLDAPVKQAGGNLVVGTAYKFRVTMVDEWGVESAGSNEVTFTPLCSQ